MAYPILNGSIVAVTFEQSLYNQAVLNTLHYRLETPTPLTDGNAALTSLFAKIDGNTDAFLTHCLLKAQSNDLKLNFVSLQWISPDRFRRRTFIPAVTAGLLAEPASPPSSAIFLETQSELAGRHGHGGIHIAGLPLSETEDGRWTAAIAGTLSALQTRVTEAITDGTSVYSPIIFNRTTPAASPIVEDSLLWGEVRTMRRRVVGRGI